ncbi:aminoglycoside 6-adenylyltransferase [Mesobacillus selenatarsenatis]|uniref:Aminoglycoside 6-adenylyltransferase n=1 Tax=Mesobacillus selenatarsenatis (strain DSM 18680 / JCM 14380 / FERM P-15431 / SF-1) TaxID=1321606 RepID=A0A0A8WXD2_MESS1|nr:aminoglycoside 6-adenylyltransferase [Mesobacillus selenatarsenatis]GAM12325.1 aminoglycoside 6-adenylyltransferase [Mesobacillus selenatarsenatis SF-1]
MRSEKDMFELILRVAEEDERIRAVYMNGSRTNPNVPKDIFQDYDIVYVVTEIASFLDDEAWIKVFGDLLMLQEPDKMDKQIGLERDPDRSYGYLMLFTDGNRIDLHIETKDSMIDGYESDKLTVPLLDKDNNLPTIPPPTDIDYQVKKPSEPMYASCTNDFWWCLQNVAKGIWRDELPYAKSMYEYTTRASLDEMVAWWIGTKYNFQVSTGKMGKFFKNYLPESYWTMYEKTYSDYNYENFWDAIFISCELFRTLAKDVADHLLFTYPIDDDKNMTKFLKHVRNLPSDAEEIL